jgi:hypothetical protein
MRRVVFLHAVTARREDFRSGLRAATVALMLSALTMSACGAGPSGETVQGKRSAILHGIEIDTLEYQAVVRAATGWSECTATFISQQLVITAAHCLACSSWMPPEAPCYCMGNQSISRCTWPGAKLGEGQDGWTFGFVDTDPDGNDRRLRLFTGIAGATPTTSGSTSSAAPTITA